MAPRIYSLIACQFVMAVAAIGLGANSIVSNFWYGVTIGDGTMSYVYGIAGGLVDAAKTAMPTAAFLIIAAHAADKTPSPAMRAARAAVPLLFGLFALLTIWSIWCAWSLQAQTVADRAGGVRAERSELGELRDEKKALDDKLDRLQRELERTAETVSGEILALEQDKIFGPRRSDGCTKATVPESREFCKRLAGLRAELLRRRSAEEIRSDIDDAEKDRKKVTSGIRGADHKTAETVIDPALTALTGALGATTETLILARSLMMSLLFEGVGSFAGVVAASLGVAIHAARAAPEPKAEKPEPAKSVRPRPGRRRVTEKQVLTAKRRLAGNEPLRQIARSMDIAESTLRNAIKRSNLETLRPSQAA